LFAFAFAFSSAFAEEPPRERARYVLETHCGQCHREDSPDALAKALSVYNLNVVDFAASMNETQLKDMQARIEGMDTRPDERRAVAAFVESELAHRKKKR
jgi:hypothetical protein